MRHLNPIASPCQTCPLGRLAGAGTGARAPVYHRARRGLFWPHSARPPLWATTGFCVGLPRSLEPEHLVQGHRRQHGTTGGLYLAERRPCKAVAAGGGRNLATRCQQPAGWPLWRPRRRLVTALRRTSSESSSSFKSQQQRRCPEQTRMPWRQSRRQGRHRFRQPRAEAMQPTTAPLLQAAK